MINRNTPIKVLFLACLLTTAQAASAFHVPKVKKLKHPIGHESSIAPVPTKHVGAAISQKAASVGNAITGESKALCQGMIKGTAGAITGLACIPAAIAAFGECEVAGAGPEDPVTTAVCPGVTTGVKIVCGATAGAVFTSSMTQPLVKYTCGD